MHRLAARYGRTVAELERTLDARELIEAAELHRLEPWGDIREDFRAATVCCTIANIFRDRRSRALRPRDFMPRFGRPPATRRPPKAEDSAAWLHASAIASGKVQITEEERERLLRLAAEETDAAIALAKKTNERNQHRAR